MSYCNVNSWNSRSLTRTPTKKEELTLRPMLSFGVAIVLLALNLGIHDCLGGVSVTLDDFSASSARLAPDISVPIPYPDYLTVNYGTNTHNEGLLRYDLSPIPAGAMVTSATLSLFQEFNPHPGAVYNIYRNTDLWSPYTVTDATAPSFDPTPAASLVIPDSSLLVYRTWDITSLVENWVTKAEPNDGVRLQAAPGTASDVYFVGLNSPSLPAPILKVEFTPAAVPLPAAAWAALTALPLLLIGKRLARSLA